MDLVFLSLILVICIICLFWSLFGWKFRLWQKLRNKCLRDYLDDACAYHGEFSYPYEAVHDGVLDYQLADRIERRARHREYFSERRLIVTQLSEQLESDIKNRYTKPLDYACKRAEKLLSANPTQRYYWGVDNKTELMIQNSLIQQATT